MLVGRAGHLFEHITCKILDFNIYNMYYDYLQVLHFSIWEKVEVIG